MLAFGLGTLPNLLLAGFLLAPAPLGSAAGSARRGGAAGGGVRCLGFGRCLAHGRTIRERSVFMKLLLAVDGSASSARARRAGWSRWRPDCGLHRRFTCCTCIQRFLMHAFASMCRKETSTLLPRRKPAAARRSPEAALAAGFMDSRATSMSATPPGSSRSWLPTKAARAHRDGVRTGAARARRAVLGSVSPPRAAARLVPGAAGQNERAMNDGSARRLDLPIAGDDLCRLRGTHREVLNRLPGGCQRQSRFRARTGAASGRMKRRRAGGRGDRQAGFRCRRSRSSWLSAA